MTNRGFLANYPADVVYVINGKPITRSDILEAKRQRQAGRLRSKLRAGQVAKPAYIWAFHVDHEFLFCGWHLYVKTAKQQWQIDHNHNRTFILPIMRLYPCGLLPMIENFGVWLPRFAEHYCRRRNQASGRPQGVALCRVTLDGRWLTNVALPMARSQNEAGQEARR